MASKFNKNCIYTGVADSFCLSCQTYLKAKDLNNHIEASEHKDTLKSVGYSEKYKDNLIWKVSQGYYCELCNVVIQTIVKVHIHVSDPTHINNKTQCLLKGHDNGIIVFDKIFIEMKAWNGLSNESCFICNIDFDNDENHKNDPKHIINLIQSKLELKEDKTVYRKIDGNLINCLICNIIVDLESKEAHIQTSGHLKEYSKCTENIKKINFYEDDFITPSVSKDENSKKSVMETNDSKSVVVKDEDDDEKKKSISNKTEIKEKPLVNTDMTCIAKVQDTTDATDNKTVLPPCEALKLAMDFAKQNNLKYKRNSTYCQVCNMKISSSLKMMKEHVSQNSHKMNVEKSEAVKLAMDFAKQNNLQYKRTSTYCKVCDIRISSSLEMMKEHVSEDDHKKNVEKTKFILFKQPMMDFIDSLSEFVNIFRHELIINEEICLSDQSFNMIGGSGGVLRCHACEVSIPTLNLLFIEVHKQTNKHKNAMQMTPVIVEFKNEFIREVRSGILHCGYCNFIEASMDGMQNHLKSINHAEKKSHWQQRLQEHLRMIMIRQEHEKNVDYLRMVHNIF